jgi:hypothetical protein
MGKNSVLLTQPNSSTGRICLGSCKEICRAQTSKINQSSDPIIFKLLDCFHLNQWQFSLELHPL